MCAGVRDEPYRAASNTAFAVEEEVTFYRPKSETPGSIPKKKKPDVRWPRYRASMRDEHPPLFSRPRLAYALGSQTRQDCQPQQKTRSKSGNEPGALSHTQTASGHYRQSRRQPGTVSLDQQCTRRPRAGGTHGNDIEDTHRGYATFSESNGEGERGMGRAKREFDLARGTPAICSGS